MSADLLHLPDHRPHTPYSSFSSCMVSYSLFLFVRVSRCRGPKDRIRFFETYFTYHSKIIKESVLVPTNIWPLSSRIFCFLFFFLSLSVVYTHSRKKDTWEIYLTAEEYSGETHRCRKSGILFSNFPLLAAFKPEQANFLNVYDTVFLDLIFATRCVMVLGIFEITNDETILSFLLTLPYVLVVLLEITRASVLDWNIK